MNNHYQNKVRSLTEGGIAIALATILSFIKFTALPQGGSVTLASMFPLILYSIRWGWKKGILVAGVYSLLSMLIKPEIYYPIQVLLDYPFAFMPIGLSGISLMKDKSKIQGYLPAVILGHLTRLLSHTLSGVFFFASYAPEGMNVWKYSIGYNASYMVPEMILSVIFLFLLWKPLKSLLVKQI